MCALRARSCPQSQRSPIIATAPGIQRNPPTPRGARAPLDGADAGPILEVEGLVVAARGVRAALVDGVSFALARGETLCIVGESGCGKSLTALALMGLLPRPAVRVTGGHARFAGRALFEMGDRELSDLRGDRIAMIFQEPMTSLNPAFRVGDQICETIVRHRGLGRAEARERALGLLRRVRIPAPEKRMDAYPHQLSGGMRQRVMIAMALANDPEVLIADEPTTALDVTIQAQILELIADLQRDAGTALILVTHDLGVVAEVADRVAVMYAGRIVEQGPVEAIFEDPQHPYTVGLLGSLPSLGRREGRLATIPGSVPPPSQWVQGCRFASRCPLADPQCALRQPALGEVAAGHAAACLRLPIDAHLHEIATR
ncbi:MAG TPA: ABC transporter ATP-binding protein [Burkholderiaceae bacterium]